MAGLKLANLINSFEIRATLNHLAGSDQKMKGRVDGVIKSLENTNKLVA